MRDHDCAFYPCYLGSREICHIAFHCPGDESIHYILAVYKSISCEIEDDNIFFHKADRIFVDHTLCVFQRRDMDRDIIALLVKLIDRIGMMDTSGELPCRFNRKIRVISVHIHSEVCRCIGDKDTDRAETYHAKLFALELSTCEGFLFLLCDLRDISVFFMLLYPVDAADDITRRKEHSRDDELFYAVCISAWCIEDDNAFFRTSVERDIVYSCSGTGNCFQVRPELHIMHLCAAHKYDICFPGLVCLYIVFVQSLQAYMGNWIQAMIFIHLTDSPLQISS